MSRVVIVGGGTAGWLTACLIAARAEGVGGGPLSVTIVESPDIPTIGVGEGTWPTMRRTLERIGIGEADFLRACDASFKQGTRFDGWRDGSDGDRYYHPFTMSVDGAAGEMAAAWRMAGAGQQSAALMSAQPTVCAQGLAPRRHAMPDYAGALNYAYHLDAGKLAALLREHAVERLGVRHVRDHVVAADIDDAGDVAGVSTRENGAVAGDFFVDCTGNAALVIGERLGVPFRPCGDILFNDRALVAQAAVAPDSPIASQTNAVAHRAGWIWDIGLPTRRGLGCVYSSAYMRDDEAETVLRDYIGRFAPGGAAAGLPLRRLTFRCGYRERFWERNCLAIGLSAGFLEPLEASAIVMIELSVEALLDRFPARRGDIGPLSRQFNARFRYRWERAVEFLKLHYVLSTRDEPYWRAHRERGSVPERLSDLLAIWRGHPPSAADLGAVDEIFPAASYQYVLYGMGAAPARDRTTGAQEAERFTRQFDQIERRTRALLSSLPTNRAYLGALTATSAPQENIR